MAKQVIEIDLMQVASLLKGHVLNLGNNISVMVEADELVEQDTDEKLENLRECMEFQ